MKAKGGEKRERSREENEDCYGWVKLGDESTGTWWQNELNQAELSSIVPGYF